MTPDIIKKKYNSKALSDGNIYKAFRRDEDGYLILIDKKVLESQKGIVGEMIKRASKQILFGGGVMRTSLPIKIMDD